MGSSYSYTKKQLDSAVEKETKPLRDEIEKLKKLHRERKPIKSTQQRIEEEFNTLVNLVRKNFSAVTPAVMNHTLNVMVCGQVSTGKSSLINCMLDERVCKTGPRPVTKRIDMAGTMDLKVCDRVYKIALWDYPGNESTYSYMTNAFIRKMVDANLILVPLTASLDYIVHIIRLAAAANKPVIFIRTHMDGCEDDEELQDNINADVYEIRNHLKLMDNPNVHGLCTKYPQNASQPRFLKDRWTQFIDNFEDHCRLLANKDPNFDKAPIYIEPVMPELEDANDVEEEWELTYNSDCETLDDPQHVSL